MTVFNTSKTDSKLVILVASATGVPQKFYSKFAAYFSQFGTVVLFDYRGVGQETKVLLDLKSSQIKREWAQDTDAALLYASHLVDNPDLVYIGHSVGGHMIGFLKNHHLIKRALFVAVSIPHWRNMDLTLNNFLWPTASNLSSLLLGYFPGSRFGLGTDLPRDIGIQWGYWSRFPSYMTHNPDTKALFNQIETPIESIGFTDDDIAKPRGIKKIILT